MVVNIEKVSQWPRVRRNHLCHELKVKSVDNRENLRFPGPSFEINWMKQFT
jgi:hypothetical protein